MIMAISKFALRDDTNYGIDIIKTIIFSLNKNYNNLIINHKKSLFTYIKSEFLCNFAIQL